MSTLRLTRRSRDVVRATILFAGLALLSGQLCAPLPDGPTPVPGSGQPQVTLQTTRGSIVIELFDRQSPLTVANFLQYVDDGFYEDTIFHAARPGQSITGGLYLNANRPIPKPTRDPVPNESNNGLRNLRGRVVLVEPDGPDSGTSAFRILLGNDSSADFDLSTGRRGATVFGKVIRGMDVADEIGALETRSRTAEDGTNLPNVPVDPVLIGRVIRGDEDLEPAPEPDPEFRADPGEDRLVARGVTVTLDGSASRSGERGGELAFLWEQTGGPSVALSDPTSSRPTFTVPESGDSFTFRLTVTDIGGETAADAVTLTVVDDPHVRLSTTVGDIVLEMLEDEAPITAVNFLQYVEDRFYDGTIFHRVIPGFVAQGGGLLPSLERQEGLRDPIVNEFSEDRPNVRRTVSMAKTADPDSATSQFFINLTDNPNLDDPANSGGFAVFARVVLGMDVVDEIALMPTGSRSAPDGQPFNDVPIDDIVILTARLQGPPDEVDPPDPEEPDDPVDPDDPDDVDEDGFITTAVGLRYRDEVVGTGALIVPGATIRVLYTGRLDDENGEIFDSALDPDNPVQFSLNTLIDGWRIGLGEIDMRVGGRRTLIIPPELGYGEAGSPPSVPPNATLWFEIEVVDVVP